MKFYFFLPLLLIAHYGYCQDKEAEAIAYYNKAEEAFNANKLDETVSRLNNAESALQATNSKILYLKINALNKLCDVNLWYLDSTKRSCDRFFAVTNKDDYPTEKYMDVVNISISIKDRQAKYDEDVKLGKVKLTYLVTPLLKCRVIEDRKKKNGTPSKNYLSVNKVNLDKYSSVTNLSNGDKYYGELDAERQKTKEGVYVWANGEVYIGEYTNDKKNGRGKYIWPDGDSYEGKWIDDEPVDGRLTIVGEETVLGESGNYEYSYEGKFLEGKKCGQGKSRRCVSVPNNKATIIQTYVGNFKNNNRDGKGTENSLSFGEIVVENFGYEGYIYSGGWENDSHNGTGSLFYIRGNIDTTNFQHREIPGSLPKIKGVGAEIYNGEFKDNHKEGRGVEQGCFDAGDISRYEGPFKDDRRDGQGTFLESDGSKYDGNFAEGLCNGRGIWVKKNGDKYDGQWLKNSKSGRGIYTYKNGNVYNGEWNINAADGEGSFSWANGNKFTGQFHFNHATRGVLTYSNGEKYDGGFNTFFSGNADTVFVGAREGSGTMVYEDGSKYEGQWLGDKRQGVGKWYNSKGKLKKEGWWEDDEYIGTKRTQ